MSIRARIRAIALAFATAGCMALPATGVQAAVVDTPELLQELRPSARDQLHAVLARDDLRQQLVEMGVDPDAAAARIERLSDSEIAALDEYLQSLPAGGDALGVGVVLVVFLVFVITDVIGATDIFPFIRPVTR